MTLAPGYKQLFNQTNTESNFCTVHGLWRLQRAIKFLLCSLPVKQMGPQINFRIVDDPPTEPS
jgi:hypothetical protein